MIIYNYNKKEDILYIIWVGSFNTEKIISNIHDIELLYSEHNQLQILIDTKDAEFQINDESIIDLNFELSLLYQKYSIIKIALVLYNDDIDLPCNSSNFISDGLDNFYFKKFYNQELASIWLQKSIKH